MTAEIAILNRSAVALATDSAVTIDTPSGPKIYESANKLFVLIKGHPVGVMIYDTAEHLGVPWETVIKAYRMSRRNVVAFPTLLEYASDFLGFLSTAPEVFPAELHVGYLADIAMRRAIAVGRRVGERKLVHLAGGGRSTSVAIVRRFLKEAIASEFALWRSLPDGPWASAIDPRSIGHQQQRLIDSQVRAGLQGEPVTVKHLADVRQLTLESLRKLPVNLEGQPLDPRSGIVIAGFGADEYFPRLFPYELFGAVDGELRYRPVQSLQAVISPENPAAIVPFAQREMVDGFMTGMNSIFQNDLFQYISSVSSAFPDAVLDLVRRHIGAHSSSVESALSGAAASWALGVVRQLQAEINRLKNEQASPVVDSVSFLPKDELASMAESLVNLTSLKRRISIQDPQTVGGPVDVAVISRGDGFVWIKRKHYFSQDLNPTWAVLHSDG